MSDDPSAYGLVFKVETAAGSGAYFTFDKVIDLTPPKPTVKVIDITHMGSPNATEESAPGMISPGTTGVVTQYIAGSATDLFNLAWLAAREKRSVKIEHLNGTVQTMSAFPTNYAPTLPLGDRQTATTDLQLSGSVTQA